MDPTDAVHMAVLAIADKPGGVDLAMVQTVVDRATTSGHRIVARASSPENETAIREQLARWTARDDIDVVIAIGGFASNAASKALAPLITETLPGFTDLFRWLAYQELGPGAMLSDAEAARCESCFVFLLPPSIEAVRHALDKLVLPQLDRRTKPRNLVMLMPRFQNLPPVRSEPPRATANVIKRKGTDDPPTKPIDVAKLERQIALSTAPTHDSPTKKIDIGGVLPRRPPGADESALEDRDTDSIIILPKRSRKHPKPVEPVARPTPPPAPPAATPPVRPAATPPVRPAVAPPAAPAPVVETSPPPPVVEPPPPVIESVPLPVAPPARPPVVQSVPLPVAPLPAPPPVVASLPTPRAPSPAPSPAVEPPPTRKPTNVITPPPPPTLASSRRPAPPTEKLIPKRRGGVGAGTKLLVAFAALTVAAAAGFVIATKLAGGDKAKPAAPAEPVATPTPAPAPPAIDAATVAVVEVDAAPSPAAIELEPPAGSGSGSGSAKPAKPAKAKSTRTSTTTVAADAGATPAEPADAAPAPAAECDQASCEAAHYEPACCAQFKPAETAATTDSGPPETLDRTMVKTGIERMKPIVIQCGEKSGAKGTVKLAVTVSADGVVQDVSVAESPDASLGECVASAIRKAKFAKTANGGSFTYPFVF